MNTANQQTPSTCPICHSTFCCCLEHLFPEQPSFHNRCKPGQAEPQGKLGPENHSQESCSWPESASLPKGVATEPYPDFSDCTEYEGLYEKAQARKLALSLAKRAAPEPTPQEGQTKRASLLEAFANILIGFWVSVLANMLVLPFFPHPGVFREAFIIGLIFTGISFVRSYLLRRLFNLFHLRTNRRSPWKP